jgi:hypothetical protein
MDYIIPKSTSKRHYIGNVDIKKFYYKYSIYEYYNLVFLFSILPFELVEKISEYLCTSLVVFSQNLYIQYVNPRDGAIIKQIKYKKLEKFYSPGISEDGLTLTYLKGYNVHVSYLCEEEPDEYMPFYIKPKNNKYNCILKMHSYPTSFLTYDVSYSILSPSQKSLAIYFNKNCVISEPNNFSYVCIYDTLTKENEAELKFEVDEISIVGFSPDETKVIIIAKEDFEVYGVWIYYINKKSMIYASYDINYINSSFHSISWSPDSKYVAIPYGATDDNEEEINYESCVLFISTVDNSFDTTCIDIPEKAIRKVVWKNNTTYAFAFEYSIEFCSVNSSFYDIKTYSMDKIEYIKNIAFSLDGDLIVVKTNFDEYYYDLVPIVDII